MNNLKETLRNYKNAKDWFEDYLNEVREQPNWFDIKTYNYVSFAIDALENEIERLTTVLEEDMINCIRCGETIKNFNGNLVKVENVQDIIDDTYRVKGYICDNCLRELMNFLNKGDK